MTDLLTDPASDLTATLRIHEPAPHIIAFYDGRIPGRRMYGDEPNWFDDGAYELGVATYAIVDGGEALVYDTHISLGHAEIIRATLRQRGVERPRVVLSHWHADHVAGNAVFADCEILAQPATFELLVANRADLEGGIPPIAPLVMPNRTVTDGTVLRVGAVEVTVRHFDIHSRDGTVLFLTETGLLLAGDTLEDPITYVAEPERLDAHLEGLKRLSQLDVKSILPNHGAEARIAAGGYGPHLIAATKAYVQALKRLAGFPDTPLEPLDELLGEDIAAGTLEMFEPYRRVHDRNVEKLRAVRSRTSQ